MLPSVVECVYYRSRPCSGYWTPRPDYNFAPMDSSPRWTRRPRKIGHFARVYKLFILY